MAKLDDRVREFIVRGLACYDTPSQVAESVKDEFGLTVTRQQVAVYDPTKVAGRELSKKWRDVFAATRKVFLDDVAQIPIASAAYRLRRLQRLHDDAMAKRNTALAAALLEQAAKEAGGAFTNARKLEASGPGGGPIPVRNDGISTALLTDDELAQLEAIRSAADARSNSDRVGTPAA